MRPILHQAAVVTASAAFVFFCSCERHKPSELAHGAHAQPAAAAHEQAGHAADRYGHDESHGANQHRATPAIAVTPAPTPAQFFPESTPR